MYMNEDLHHKLKNLPMTPGVYRFLNREGEILYVGVSKHLRERVRSYFSGEKQGKIARLLLQIHDLEVELCDTYLEARLLECRRIKEIRPPYNAQFKREKGCVYLKIGTDPSGPSLSLARDPEGAIGPFRERRLVGEVLADFPALFPLQLTRRDRGPDIRFHFSFLPRRLDRAEFETNRQALEGLFHEEKLWQPFLAGLDEAMLKAAEGQRFAEAAFFRDFGQRLKLLHRFWFRDRAILKDLMFLKIPAASGGVKYFRVCNGMIEDVAKGTGEGDVEFRAFCLASACRPDPTWLEFPDKALFDFRHILYSEIRQLPEDQVILPGETALDQVILPDKAAPDDIGRGWERPDREKL